MVPMAVKGKSFHGRGKRSRSRDSEQWPGRSGHHRHIRDCLLHARVAGAEASAEEKQQHEAAPHSHAHAHGSLVIVAAFSGEEDRALAMRHRVVAQVVIKCHPCKS